MIIAMTIEDVEKMSDVANALDWAARNCRAKDIVPIEDAKTLIVRIMEMTASKEAIVEFPSVSIGGGTIGFRKVLS